MTFEMIPIARICTQCEAHVVEIMMKKDTLNGIVWCHYARGHIMGQWSKECGYCFDEPVPSGCLYHVEHVVLYDGLKRMVEGLPRWKRWWRYAKRCWKLWRDGGYWQEG